ncbi:unnamed protein product [Rotaria sordida]|uniref:Uncharacterized protein n=1 Tax=Rotaria sordida TaxID=392033 RepID=A0A815I5A6_9BILA|nr:unnamed protein product [Rotaria sordida]CAF3911479.1 unnamed protein product [Rotaria sordida]
MKGIAQGECDEFFFLSAEVIVDLMTKGLQSVFDVCGTQAKVVIRDRNNTILKYNLSGNFEGEPLIATDQLSVTVTNDESFIQQFDPKVRTLDAVQVAGEMIDRIAQLIQSHGRHESISLITEHIALLKQ